MPRSSLPLRNLVALAALVGLTILFVSLGKWQLRRAAERDATAQAIQNGRGQAELVIKADTPKTELQPWRPSKATGTLLNQFTVLIENRNYQGRPGVWVATPLALDDAPGYAVLVLRGWLPRTGYPQQTPQVVPAVEQQPVTLHGELLERVPRLFEMWSWSGGSEVALPAHLPDPAHAQPTVQNLELDAFARASGLKLVPAVLAQLKPAQYNGANLPDTLLREWPEPSIDSNTNRGYALQWFGFATIAALAALVLGWRTLVRRSRST
jgi:cytochrome oxidase assembly protein ShyY1